MAYNKYTWKSGDVISSARLNNIENGIEEAMSSGGGVMIVNVTKSEEDYTTDKTFDEIKAAIDNGQTVVANYQNEALTPIGNVVFTNYLPLCQYFDSNSQLRFVFDDTTPTTHVMIEIIKNDVETIVTVLEQRLFVSFITNLNYTEENGQSTATYSKAYDFNFDDVISAYFGVKLIVISETKTMIYTMSEFYPKDQVIAFSGAGKVGPLYMDKDGNISETYPTSIGSDGDDVV